MKTSLNLYGRMDGSKFWRFPWFLENSLVCVILRYTVYTSRAVQHLFNVNDLSEFHEEWFNKLMHTQKSFSIMAKLEMAKKNTIWKYEFVLDNSYGKI